MITREEVRDLLPGDVITLTSVNWSGASMTGPLVEKDGSLFLGTVGMTTGGGFKVRHHDGRPVRPLDRSMTVVSRVPRPKPMFVNSPREHLVSGDVVNYPPTFFGQERTPFVYGNIHGWAGSPALGAYTRWRALPNLAFDRSPEGREGQYTLLIDGTTGLPPVTS